jgi:2-iminoacetate synthase ThiH
VPLRFIYLNTMLYQKGLVQPSPTGLIDMRMYAVSRCMLRGVIDNLQTSWVKLGHPMAQLSLGAGCNDFGGTLMEESISREAGADAGEYTSAAEIEALIREMGRIPAERTTLYGRRERGGAGDGETARETDRGAGGWSGRGAISGRADASH